MKKLNLLVLASDQEYVQRLADYVRDHPVAAHWHLRVFTRMEACQAALKEGSITDVLLVEEGLVSAIQPHCHNALLIKLIGTGKSAVEAISGEANDRIAASVSVYQSVPQLLRQLEGIVSQQASSLASIRHHPTDDRHLPVYAVYSASGGMGKTTLCLHLAHAISAQGKRVLYLNLERWGSAEHWLGVGNRQVVSNTEKENVEGLSELLYLLKTRPQEAGEWLLKHRKHDASLQIEYIAGWSNREDRALLTEEEGQQLLQVIRDHRQYDAIIVDLDEELAPLQLAIFEQSDAIIWLHAGNASITEKQALAQHYALQKWGERFEKVLDRVIRVYALGPPAEAASELEGSAEKQEQWNVGSFSFPFISEWSRSGSVLLAAPKYRAAAEQLAHWLSGVRQSA